MTTTPTTPTTPTTTTTTKATIQPSDLRVGLRVEWSRASKFQARDSAPCDRCKGAGYWNNPRNPSDRRPCFGCSGSGVLLGAKLRGENGSLVWDVINEGAVGTVVDWRSFGRFYKTGYNVPNPNNTTVKVKLDDGRVVNATLAALRELEVSQ